MVCFLCMSRRNLLITGIVFVILFAMGATQFLFTNSVVSPSIPTATSTAEQVVSTTTVPVVTVTDVRVKQKDPITDTLALIKVDSIASWNFKGAYTGNPELTEKAQNEIARLSEQLATATSSAMILSVSIANQYELLGDGKRQYEYLERAIKAGPENGLPWHNLGVLMERLGVIETARVAYEKSTLVQPEWKLYHYAYLEFLISRMKDDTAIIEKAFAWATKNVGQTSYFAELRTEWQTQ